MGHKRARTYVAQQPGEKAQEDAYIQGVQYFQDLLEQPDAGWEDFMSGTSDLAWDESQRRGLEQLRNQESGYGWSPLRQGPAASRRAEFTRMHEVERSGQEAQARMGRFGRVEEGAHGTVGSGPGKPTILRVGAKPQSSSTLGQIGSLVGTLGGAYLGGPGGAALGGQLGGMLGGGSNPYQSLGIGGSSTGGFGSGGGTDPFAQFNNPFSMRR